MSTRGIVAILILVPIFCATGLAATGLASIMTAYAQEESLGFDLAALNSSSVEAESESMSQEPWQHGEDDQQPYLERNLASSGISMSTTMFVTPPSFATVSSQFDCRPPFKSPFVSKLHCRDWIWIPDSPVLKLLKVPV